MSWRGSAALALLLAAGCSVKYPARELRDPDDCHVPIPPHPCVCRRAMGWLHAEYGVPFAGTRLQTLLPSPGQGAKLSNTLQRRTEHSMRG